MYLAKRILKGFVTLLFSITITFFIIRLMPSDPASLMVDPKLGPEVKEALIKAYGLDKPLFEQYFIYIKGIFTGDLGLSFRSRLPVSDVLMQRLPWTLLLLFIVVLITFIFGVLIGVFAARKKGSYWDKTISALVTFGVSAFIPFLSFGLLYLFSYLLKWLPTGGAYTPPPATGMAYIIDVLKHAILPAAALVVINMASTVLYTRNSMVEVLKEDYIRTAYSKGLNENRVVNDHAVKNALIPTVTVTGILIGSMVGGAVMTETIFSWPGVGRLIYESVSALDYPVLQGAFLVLAISVVIMNILTDLVVAWLDPRIKLGG